MKQGWEIKKLGDICTIKGRIGFRGYTRNDLVEEGEGAITLSPSNIVNDVINFDKCQYISWYKYDESPEIQIFEGDVIYAKTASIGKVAIIKHLPEKATINPQFVVFKDIKCNHDFLYYAVRGNGFKEQVSLIINGVAIPTISQSNMAKLTIPVPPIAEQEKIVAELDCLSGIIEKKKQQLKELDNLAQSIFYEMFGDPVENDKGWEVKKIGEVCIVERGGSPRPINAFITDDENGVNWIKIGDATEGSRFITSTKEKIIPEGVRKSRMVYKGDFILSNSMSFGRPYIMGIDGCIHDGWLVLRDKDNVFDKTYLYYYLGSSHVYQEFKRLAVGGVVNNLNSELVRGVRVAIPSFSVQQEFASRIELIEKQKELIALSIKETETLFNSRMDYYFN